MIRLHLLKWYIEVTVKFLQYKGNGRPRFAPSLLAEKQDGWTDIGWLDKRVYRGCVGRSWNYQEI